MRKIETSTQSVEAVVEMLNFLGVPSNPLPDVVKLSNGAQLTKSSRGDCYYYTSPKDCTCPGFFYRHNCKHIKALQTVSAKPRGQTFAETLEEADKNLHKMPKSYQRMVLEAREEAEAEPLEMIHKGGFRPVLPGEEA